MGGHLQEEVGEVGGGELCLTFDVLEDEAGAREDFAGLVEVVGGWEGQTVGA